MMDMYQCCRKVDEFKQKTGAAAMGALEEIKDTLSAISDGTLYRTMLVSFGVLIGTAFHKFFRKHKALVACVALASAALVLYRILSGLDED